MLNQIRLIILGIAILATAASVYLGNLLLKEREHSKELNAFIDSQRDTVTHYKNKTGQLVATIEVLEVSNKTLRDLKEELAPLTNQFNGINKRLSNLESLMHTTVDATKSFDLQAKDSVIYLPDSTKLTVWAFEEIDPYFSLDGYVVPASKRVFATPHLSVDVTGAEIVKRRKVLGLRIGKRDRRYELTTTNPYIQFGSISFYRKK